MRPADYNAVQAIAENRVEAELDVPTRDPKRLAPDKDCKQDAVTKLTTRVRKELRGGSAGARILPPPSGFAVPPPPPGFTVKP
jgi:hypothetical protein